MEGLGPERGLRREEHISRFHVQEVPEQTRLLLGEEGQRRAQGLFLESLKWLDNSAACGDLLIGLYLEGPCMSVYLKLGFIKSEVLVVETDKVV